MQCNSDPRGTPSCQITYSNAGRVCHHARGSRIASAIARSHSSQVKEIMSLDPRRYGREWVAGPDSTQCGPREGNRGPSPETKQQFESPPGTGEARRAGATQKSHAQHYRVCNPSQAFHVERPLPAASRGVRPRRSGDKTSFPSYIKIAKMLALQARKKWLHWTVTGCSVVGYLARARSGNHCYRAD